MEENTADREASTADIDASRTGEASDVEGSVRKKGKHRRRSKKSSKDTAAKTDEATKAGENQGGSSQEPGPSDRSSSSKNETTEKSSGSRRRKKRSRGNSVSEQPPPAAAEEAQDRKEGDIAAKAPSSTPSVAKVEAPPAGPEETAPRQYAAETPQEKRQRYQIFNDLTKTVALIASLAIVIIIIILGPNGTIPSDHPTCTTEGCTLYAQRLLASLNASAAAPCYNFKEFVCDGWKRRNTYSVRQNMTVTALDALTELAHSAHVPLKGQTTAQKGLAFFRSCDAVLKKDRNELVTVKKMLAEAKIEWPRRPTQPDVLYTLFYSSIRLRWSPIFNIEIETTDTYATRVFMMPHEDFDIVARKYTSLKKAEATERRAYFDVLGDEFGASAADQTVVSFKEVDNSGQVMLEPLLDALAKERKPTAISTAWLYRPGADPSKARWQSVLASYGVKGNETVIYETETLPFVTEFFNLWARYGEAMIEVLVSWCTVQVAALYANQRLVANYYGTQDAALLRYGAFCLSKAYLIAGFSVFAPYVGEEVAQPDRRDVEDIALSVRRAFHARLMTWEHYEPERTVVGDWDSVSFVFRPFYGEDMGVSNVTRSYPDMGESLAENWRNAAVPLEIIRSDKAYAALKSLKLHILLDYDFLLLPFAAAFPYYHPNATRPMKYGGVGKEVALALSEAFLDTYARFDDAKKAIDSASICMTGAPDSRSNLEAIALQALFDAFNNASSDKDVRLPGLDDYTASQIFFIASCYAKCSGSSGDTDEDCNVAFRYVSAFADAFKCPPLTYMNPADPCHLF